MQGPWTVVPALEIRTRGNCNARCNNLEPRGYAAESGVSGVNGASGTGPGRSGERTSVADTERAVRQLACTMRRGD